MNLAWGSLEEGSRLAEGVPSNHQKNPMEIEASLGSSLGLS